MNKFAKDSNIAFKKFREKKDFLYALRVSDYIDDIALSILLEASHFDREGLKNKSFKKYKKDKDLMKLEQSEYSEHKEKILKVLSQFEKEVELDKRSKCLSISYSHFYSKMRGILDGILKVKVRKKNIRQAVIYFYQLGEMKLKTFTYLRAFLDRKVNIEKRRFFSCKLF